MTIKDGRIELLNSIVEQIAHREQTTGTKQLKLLALGQLRQLLGTLN